MEISPNHISLGEGGSKFTSDNVSSSSLEQTAFWPALRQAVACSLEQSQSSLERTVYWLNRSTQNISSFEHFLILLLLFSELNSNSLSLHAHQGPYPYNYKPLSSQSSIHIIHNLYSSILQAINTKQSISIKTEI